LTNRLHPFVTAIRFFCMNKLFLLRAILFGLLFTYISNLSAQQAKKEALLLCRTLEKNHYSPRSIDDQLSREVFTKFLKTLDRNGLYFLASDYKEFTAYEFSIDDELKGKSWGFLPLVTERYKQRLIDADKTIAAILEKPFDYSSKELIKFPEEDSLSFSADEKAYQLQWSKYLKYKTLWQLVSLYQDSSVSDQTILSKESSIRQKVKVVQKRKIKRILESPNGYENYIASLFFGSVTCCFDPHSVYMSKTDWENFESSLSREAFSFGMDLDENEAGDVYITRLVPGGPAWKSNELHKDDVLTELKWEGKEAIDLTGAESDEVEGILESSNSIKLDITVRTSTGMYKTVSLVKEKIREEDNIVKSYILKGDKKIGYISLPGFYSEWENMSPLGCSNDVAKEIIKLKEEKIDGLILDIRYNGGGSLIEGLNLAGIFINEGPLFMMQSSDKKPYVMKDMNRGTVYDGPLVLMVNGQSASASEVLASTLQDYNRALIVGSTTYGKATGQIVIPMDSTINPSDLEKTGLRSEYGVSTVTVKKLYRITGKSAQLKGVIPDIHLPDIYEVLEYREMFYKTALPSDSVSKKVVYSPLSPLPVKNLSEKSKARVSSNNDFQLLKKIIDSQVKIQKEMNLVSLNFTQFKNKTLANYKEWEMLEKNGIGKSSVYTVENTSYDKELMNLDNYSKEINDILTGNIKEDIYIQESFHIITDLINH